MRMLHNLQEEDNFLFLKFRAGPPKLLAGEPSQPSPPKATVNFQNNLLHSLDTAATVGRLFSFRVIEQFRKKPRAHFFLRETTGMGA